MFSLTIRILFFSCLPMLLYSQKIHATIQGKIECTITAKDFNISLPSINSVVGEDAPLGAMLYQGTISYPINSQSNTITCKRTPSTQAAKGYLKITHRLGGGWMNPVPSNINGGAIIPGFTYKTNVDGIGFIIVNNTDKPLDFSEREHDGFDTSGTPLNNIPIDLMNNGGIISDGHVLNYTIRIVKIGDISPGSHIMNNNFVIETRYQQKSNNVNVLPYTGSKMRISNHSAITLTTGSCTTPDITVPMGDYIVSDFRGVNSTTSWVDVPLTLKNCPRFLGTVQRSWIADKHGNASILEKASNYVDYYINAANGLELDNSKGMINLSTVNDAASGIAIQVGLHDNGVTSAIKLNSWLKRINLPDDGRKEIVIPLKVRYIQTESMIKPGVANSSAIFTIKYK